MRLATFLVFLSFALVPCFATAQAAAPSPAASTPVATSAQAAQTPATQTAVYTLPPDKLAKSKALYDISGRMRIIGTVFSFVVLLALLYLGIVARYRDWAEKASRYSFVQAMIVVPLFLLTVSLLGLPLDMYSHKVGLDYGLSVQGWGSWFGDFAKGQAISLVLGTVLLWLMIFIIRKSPRRWWFYFWFPAYAMFFLLIYSAPLIFDPLFNKFEPLQKTDPQLVTSIEHLTRRAGVEIPPQRMFLMKASEKTTQLNAYVTGFGASKRVVIWDTTIQKTTNPETLFVVGHEMGHYVLNHIVYGLVLGAIGIFIALFLIYVISGWMLRRFQERWHIRSLGDWAALPMIFLILSIVGFVSAPIGNSISRQLEHNADIYGLEVTHGINANSQEVAAHAFQTLGEISLVYPYPSRFVVFWYYNHPSIPDRVRFAHNYDPWDKGQQPKYVK
ncbi:MAG TPA: M48 family metallopeptidase [Candidatus Limnocylindrales bacterium]|nr:M48 family metallopeptidase [Candidatus Limnocylindrales bacterium]